MPALLMLVTLVLAVACLRAAGIVYVGRTMGGLTIVHDDTQVLGEHIRVLEVSGTYQSATFLDERWAEPVFPYHRLFDHLLDPWPAGGGPASVAVLGGGGYAIPKHLVAHHPQIARIDVVEIDPAIERLARRHFFLDRVEAPHFAGRLHLHTADARSWLEGCGQRFDVIVNDCFLGDDPERSLMTPAAAQLIYQHLTPAGLYLSNVVSALAGQDATTIYDAIESLAASFAHVWVYPCSANDPDRVDNNVVIATDADWSFEGAWAWPPREAGL